MSEVFLNASGYALEYSSHGMAWRSSRCFHADASHTKTRAAAAVAVSRVPLHMECLKCLFVVVTTKK